MLTHSVVNLRGHLSDHLRVAHVERVREDQVFGQLFLVLRDSLLECLVCRLNLLCLGRLDRRCVQFRKVLTRCVMTVLSVISFAVFEDLELLDLRVLFGGLGDPFERVLRNTRLCLVENLLLVLGCLSHSCNVFTFGSDGILCT